MRDAPLFAAVMPVGPGDREVARLRDMIDALAHHEPHRGTLVIVDDVPEPRGVEDLPVPDTLRAVVLPHRRTAVRTFRKGIGVCAPVMTGFAWVARHLDVSFALKFDTDSLVIAPFSDRVAALFERHPDVGMAGAYARSPGGGRRDWSHHGRPIRALARHPALHALLRRPAPAPSEAMRHVRALVAAARRHGYVAGEHCLGGGYAIAGRTLRAMAADGWLDHAALWQTIDLPEDVMNGLHVRAVGHGFLDDVDEGGVFGVKYIGLPFPPDELERRGYGIIHAVKNDALPEAEIRDHFASRRAAARGAAGPSSTMQPG